MEIGRKIHCRVGLRYFTSSKEAFQLHILVQAHLIQKDDVIRNAMRLKL